MTSLLVRSDAALMAADALHRPMVSRSGPWLRLAGFNSLSSADAALTNTAAALSAAIFLMYIGRSAIRRQLPAWLRPFAQEEPPPVLTRPSSSSSRWTVSLLFAACAGLVCSIAPILLGAGHRTELGHLHLPILDVVPWLSAVLITALDRPAKTPRILMLLYLTILTVGLASVSFRFLFHSLRMHPFQLARLGLCSLALIIIGCMPLRDPSWGATTIGGSGTPSSLLRSPEDNTSLFGFWTMTWVYPLARLCRKKEISEEDVWQLPFEFQHSRLYMAFRELEGRLLPCLVRANGLDLLVATALMVATKVAEVTTIRLTSELYAALDRSSPGDAYFWCLVILCLDAARQVLKTTSSWYSRKAYERSRGETFIALFCKLLTRAVPGSDATEKGPDADGHNNHHDDDDDDDDGVKTLATPPTRFGRIMRRFCGFRRRAAKVALPAQPASNAKVVNLVRGDTYEISQQFWNFPKIVSQPIKVVITMYYLVDIMGWPSAIGFGLMGLFLLINSALVKRVITLERARTAHSDKRAQAVAHFVEASRPLKLNGWTWSWSDRIMRFRDLEMAKRLQISYVTAAISTVGVVGGAAYPLASIFLYTVVLGQGLPNNVIWPSLQLFAELEASVKEAFDLISAFWKATIPVERVNKYMGEPDRDEDSAGDGASADITFRDASFAWPSTDKLALENINLRFPRGLTVVRGQVGSGKSSLLLAALNEMELASGTFTRPDCPVAYAQQLPWLQNKTIRDNILFHHGYDPARYAQALHACALGIDLAALPGGDQTRLGEGGIGLSGGQKARVALARAVYSPSPVLLLDDPLAALDHDTASAIVQRLLRGPLAEDRTIVMVTHRDDLVLGIADQVIDMHGGRARVLTREEIQEELAHPYHRSSNSKQASSGNGDDADADADASPPAEDLAAGLGKDAPEEAGETGSVSLSLYTKYMRAGGWSLWLLLALAYAVSRFCDISRARLLEAWGASSAGASPSMHLSGHRYFSLPDPEEHPGTWLCVLAGLSLGQIAAHGSAQLLLARICIGAAQRLFKAAIDKVGRATFRYHDTTPSGQLKNRLVSDMGMVDGGIAAPLEAFVFQLIALGMSVAAIAAHQPALLAVLALVAALFVSLFRAYVPVSRSLRRMEMRYLTPIIANIGVMQDGLVTIRAQRVHTHFQARHLDAVDDFQKQDHFFWGMAFWLDSRLGAAASAARAALIVLMVAAATPAAAVGFVLTQTTIAMAAVQQLCERFAQLQLDAVSLERVDALGRIPEEPAARNDPSLSADLPPDWPRPGDDILFERLSFRYAAALPAVLDDVSLRIPGGSTCAVLGRTGSGKSTIANALLLTHRPSAGRISIGPVDLRAVDPAALRNRITFIQQDPTLFPGSLRDNIDPEARFPDAACASALARVLGPGFPLDFPVHAEGKNLSQGQRQLVGIARAVLRRSGLVILDEATASIDRATAATVQRILREELASSTVVTIAHRLEAVEDADWCLRLDAGRVVECGPARGLIDLS
ncbi:ATP-dependent bile acid permease [Escovopsis weberi]|uniref:ATP-dependent bile acid permease n=1 Tax=Escovopsis weberi TaxID=150374 RepID=A0A0M8N8J7_ESCWE|nr:ATP-dependent bile acid permease [Escovopsis weberi]